MKFWKVLIVCICAILYGVPMESAKKKILDVSFALPTSVNTTRIYGDLDYNLRINVKTDLQANRLINLSELPSKEASNFPKVELENSIRESAEEFLYNLASSLGFKVGGSHGSSFLLRVTIRDFQLRVRSFDVKKNVFSSSAAMVVSWELINPDGEIALASTTSTGRSTARNLENLIVYPLAEAYTQALCGIDWDRIASQMKIAKTAKQEKTKEVKGTGNTALEHTVIRWNIVSKPQGADVYWRVVSSTPDVANTNANYIGTTPYESTETFDIKGLSYNNSGNVQIEVTCEKSGYITQHKRFNLRQVIDQKEISTKFNLVKEDDEE